jgi:hypothetical protein
MTRHPLESATASRPGPALLGLFVMICMCACAQLGLVAPKTFTEKLAAGYIAHTAVLTSATAALDAGDIKSADAEEVLKIANESRKVLDGAKLANAAGDIQTAEGRLTVATAILTQLQTFLREKGHQ